MYLALLKNLFISGDLWSNEETMRGVRTPFGLSLHGRLDLMKGADHGTGN
jgi:hypothetical protein